jgi:glycosyltransferase involved in cell wall biosynthesis
MRAKLQINDGDVVVGMCGAANWGKGADLFLLLAKAVALRRGPRRHIFLWIGVHTGSEAHRQMIHDRALLGLEQTVKLIPPVSNPHDYLSAIDVFTLTSREDSFSLVSLESAALGIPVICFAGGGGCPDLVGPDGGQVVPYLDIPAMAQAVFTLSDDVNLRSQVGAVLRDRAAALSTLETQAPKLLAVIQKNRLAR